MRLLMVSAEYAPVAKVGGLADAAGGLARALATRGHDVRVVLPLYGHPPGTAAGPRVLRKLPPLAVRVGGVVHDIRFHVAGAGKGVRIYLVGAELFARPGIYTDAAGQAFPDVLARAAVHTQAALLLPRLLEWPVDVVHAHDAAAVPALVYRRQWWRGRDLPGPAATVLTIHNLAHQEVHPATAVGDLGLPAALGSYPGLLEFHGSLNLLKAGIVTADRVNTVSPGYARETVTDPALGCGLETVLRGRGDGYVGILNGGDYATWDPRRDPHLAASYGPRNLAGKAACTAALQRELGIAPAAGRPLCGFVGRLFQQKGADLLLPLVDRLAEDGFAFAVLGTGDPEHEASLSAAARRWPRRVAFTRAFDEALAHRIYAGSQLFLMPSRFEPCGLSQMYALRYGTPPVVRRTGGLADTVLDAANKAGTGFVFERARTEELLAALRRAEAAFADAEAWRRLQERGMACEFSWDVAAARYEELYAGALAAGRARGGG